MPIAPCLQPTAPGRPELRHTRNYCNLTAPVIFHPLVCMCVCGQRLLKKRLPGSSAPRLHIYSSLYPCRLPSTAKGEGKVGDVCVCVCPGVFGLQWFAPDGHIICTKKTGPIVQWKGNSKVLGVRRCEMGCPCATYYFRVKERDPKTVLSDHHYH